MYIYDVTYGSVRGCLVCSCWVVSAFFRCPASLGFIVLDCVRGSCSTDVRLLCAAIWCSFRVMLWILGCVYPCLCHSFVCYLCWFCICGIFPVYLGVFLSCVFLWCPWCLLWCRICVPCLVCDLRIQSYCYCSWLNVCAPCIWKVLSVCPMYFSGQSRHFIWYMPLSLYLSFCGFCLGLPDFVK
jgi:hypothetical protein